MRNKRKPLIRHDNVQLVVIAMLAMWVVGIFVIRTIYM